jgi:hypothetical protein
MLLLLLLLLLVGIICSLQLLAFDTFDLLKKKKILTVVIYACMELNYLLAGLLMVLVTMVAIFFPFRKSGSSPVAIRYDG